MPQVYDTEYLSLPQQVQQNKDDIEWLKQNGIIFNPLGLWNNDTQYDKNDFVYYGSSSYLATQANLGYRPDINAQYWQPIARGIQGAKGDKGDTGAQGPQGLRGLQGEQGPQGVAGPKGDKGDTGEQGPQGVAGPQGPQGVAGATGATGAIGPQGPQGPQGTQGPQGLTGPQGPQGIQGAQGQKGDPGKDGTSFIVTGSVADSADLPDAGTVDAGTAYFVGAAAPRDIYVVGDNAGVKTWINQGQLQGPQGEQGVQGIQGIQGIQGETGPQGATGPAGPQGPQGETGPAGPAGPQGVQGETGPKGDKGDQGETGAQGPQGVQGPQGAQGPQGVGISAITSGTASVSGGQTLTPVNITYTDSTSDEIIVYAQNGQDAEFPMVSLTGTSGTLTAEQLSTLQSNDEAYIMCDNEVYRLADKQTSAGYLVYSHTGQDSTQNFFVKCITITISQSTWVMTSKEVGGGNDSAILYAGSKANLPTGTIIFPEGFTFANSTIWMSLTFNWKMNPTSQIYQQVGATVRLNEPSLFAAGVTNIAIPACLFDLDLSKYYCLLGLRCVATMSYSAAIDRISGLTLSGLNTALLNVSGQIIQGSTNQDWPTNSTIVLTIIKDKTA